MINIIKPIAIIVLNISQQHLSKYFDLIDFYKTPSLLLDLSNMNICNKFREKIIMALRMEINLAMAIKI